MRPRSPLALTARSACIVGTILTAATFARGAQQPPPGETPTTQPAPTPPPTTQPDRPAPPALRIAPPTSQPTPTDSMEPVVTESGLKYYDLKVGEGESPTPSSRVRVNYWGWREDGTLFDTSQRRGGPATLSLGAVVPGWTEGITSMRVGGKRKLVIPPELAYGESGRPPMIPPNATLTFEVELLGVEETPRMPNLADIDFNTTGSGVKFHDIVVGEGEPVTRFSLLSFRFKGWLADGTWWGGTPEDGEPRSAGTVNPGFPGWTDGILGMKPGGTRLILIPPELGFAREPGASIPQDSAIVMEVELVKNLASMTPTDDQNLTTTDSGLKYLDLKVGEGDEATPTSLVTAHYTGWTEDGIVVDSTARSDSPRPLRLDRAMPGLRDGIAGMKVGGKRKIIVPPEQGTASQPPRRGIPQDATLIYEVELFSVAEAPPRPSRLAPPPTTQPATPPEEDQSIEVKEPTATDKKDAPATTQPK